ncbi:hypothetical protein MKW98_013072 [Papaver atlanticum]|uniref:UspA domain-containing protein n=1 Tax=Papaver atlanticum TaxID=357466 RepID=A0AAD4T5S7_9MAGN|nr:hypothetical protein MKW98_013072 [Papaver atlanticum]
MAEKSVVVVGIDDSEQSIYALEWALDHFFVPLGSDSIFKLVIVHAQPTPSSVVGLAGPGAADVFAIVQVDLTKISKRILEKAKEICIGKSVNDDMLFEVVEGDPRSVLCEAVEKHHAIMLVVGSHGYGAIKRAVLGSVSDYCAHHAHCSVMIVKKPKIKH